MSDDDIRRVGHERWLDKGEDEIWDINDVCEVFIVTKNTVYKMNRDRVIPYRYFGKHVRYFRSDVLNYFMARTPDDADLNKWLSLGELPPIFKRRHGPKQPKKRAKKQEPNAPQSDAA